MLGLLRWNGIRIGAAALLLNLAYPPFHLLVPAFVCLAPLLSPLIHPAAVRHHAWQGFWFGLLANALTFHWMAAALWTYDAKLAWLYGPAMLALGGCYAALFGFVAWVRQRTGASLLVLFPLAWTALEWSLAHGGLVALSWLGLGTSLTGFPILVQVADVAGARGVTLLLAAANVAVALAWERRGTRGYRPLVGGLALGCLACLAYGAVRMRTLHLRSAGRVTVVQPNVGAREKWRIEAQDSIVAATLALSAQAARTEAPDLIVWPEVAVPAYLGYRPHWERELQAQTQAVATPLLFGTIELDVGPDSVPRWFNAARLIEPRARREPQPSYRKRSLVPLFERFNGFVAGRAEVLLTTPVGRVGVLICSETGFEQYARHHRKAGAQLLVEISNDAWFDITSGPSQHAAHLTMRAIENRIGVVRSANTGPSGFVDPLGRQEAWTRRNETTTLTRRVVTSDAFALYPVLGDWVGLASWLGVLGLAAAALLRRRTWRAAVTAPSGR